MPGLACTGEGRCPRHPDIRKRRSLLDDGSRRQAPGWPRESYVRDRIL